MSKLMKQLERLSALVEGQQGRNEQYQFGGESDSKSIELKGKLESLGKRMSGLADFVESGNTKSVIVGLRKVIDDANALLTSLNGGSHAEVSQDIGRIIKRRKGKSGALKDIIKKSVAKSDMDNDAVNQATDNLSRSDKKQESRKRGYQVIDLMKHPIRTDRAGSTERAEDTQSNNDPLGMGESLSEHIAAVMKASDKVASTDSSSKAEEG